MPKKTMIRWTILYLNVIFILNGHFCRAQQSDTSLKSKERTLSQITGRYMPIYCDSITYVDLVATYDWTILPKGYTFVKCDSVIGRYKINIRLIRNSKTVAYGSLDRMKRPTGWWGIKSNIENPLPNQDICCAGQMKKGKKEKRWWAMDGFVLHYSKDGQLKVTHNKWADD